MTATSRRLPPRRHPDTSVEYDGDDSLRLAEEIDAALDKYGLGNNRRIFTGRDQCPGSRASARGSLDTCARVFYMRRVGLIPADNSAET
jgi:hypothetical protein